MKKIVVFVFLLFILKSNFAQNNVGINATGANPDPSAALDIDASDKGLLIPRITTAQRLAIVNPANGLLVYDVDQKCIFFYDLTTVTWKSLCSGGGTIGVTGPAGTQGPQGPTGVSGVTGPQGIQGVTGSQGLQGTTGLSGITGPTGIQGVTGNMGPTGTQGIQGIQGSTGAQGIQGTTGLQGIMGSIGPTGPQGLQGVTGPFGPIGLQGVRGITGPTGQIGVTGPTGIESNNHWSITGNTGTIAGTNFLGTTDAQPLVLKTNNTEWMRILTGGNVGIGTTTPAAKLEIDGASNSTIKIVDGNQAAGKVLTSDATGQGSWQNNPAASIHASAQATDATALSTAATVWIDMTSMTVTLTTAGGNLHLSFSTQSANGTPGGIVAFRFTVDGVPVTLASWGNAMAQTPPGAATYYQESIAANWLATGIAAGTHTVKVQWRVNLGAAVAPEIGEESNRTLVVVEIR
jgi:hypothetical protein